MRTESTKTSPDDPAMRSQRTFRNVLDAMARPGRIVDLGPAAAVDGLSPAMAALLLCLADYETPLWLCASATRAADWLRFHTGAAVVSNPVTARFVVIDGHSDNPPLSAFDPGEDRYPDRSATLLMACVTLVDGLPVTLAGPGIRKTVTVAPNSLPAGFWNAWRSNSQRFPLGVDVIFCAGTQCIGLPRSTRVTTNLAETV
jgi:alpha-D-ribose 1-methylphosphonate 5-triphosphate synthase subunit PhnH